MTANNIFPSFVEYQESHHTQKTAYTRKSCLTCHLLPTYGDTELEDISHHDIDDICDGMEADGLKPNTVFGTFYTLRCFFKYAVELGYISENPVSLAKIRSSERKGDARNQSNAKSAA